MDDKDILRCDRCGRKIRKAFEFDGERFGPTCVKKVEALAVLAKLNNGMATLRKGK